MDIQEQANALYRGAALAPMVRASTTPLRTLALQYGADFVYTEELVDRAITETIRVKNPTLGTIDYVKDPAKLSKKTLRKLQRDNNRPCLILRIDPKVETETKNRLICQLGTGEPELALPAAKHVFQDVAAIDINMGCPKKFSVSGGMGSALLKDPDRASRIVKTLRAEIPKPVSVKIRLNRTVQETVDFCEAMINAGANAVAIHARRPGHESSVAADWNTLEEVLGLLRPKYPNFPLLVNGDFYERKERRDFIEKTKVDGVLLGRPALYNTSTFLPFDAPLLDKTQVIQTYLQKSIRYDMHYKNAKYVICEMMNNRRAPSDRVPFLPQEYHGGQTIAKTCSCNDYKAMCQVWNINWASSETLAKEVAATTMTAGEHRYEDSYFMKHDRDNNDKHLEESQAKKLKSNGSVEAKPTTSSIKNSNTTEKETPCDDLVNEVSAKKEETSTKDTIDSNKSSSSLPCRLQ